MVSPKANAFLLLGKEKFLKERFLADLRAKSFPSGTDSSINTLDTAAPEGLYAFIDFLSTAPFLAPVRFAILRAADSLDDEAADTLGTFLKTLPANSVAVLVSEETTQKNSALKKLSAHCLSKTFAPIYENQAPAWLKSHAAGKGASIDPRAGDVLLERIGNQPAFLDKALDQLLTYAAPRKHITAADVEDLIGKSAESDVFALADALLERRVQQALSIVSNLLRNDVKSFEIVSVLAAQFERVKRAKKSVQEGVSEEEVATLLRVHPYFVGKLIRQARMLKDAALGRIFKSLLECDETIKTSRIDDELAVEMLVLKICEAN